jgi:PA14 domain
MNIGSFTITKRRVARAVAVVVIGGLSVGVLGALATKQAQADQTAPVGTGLTYEYFANETLSGKPTNVDIDAVVDFDWGVNGVLPDKPVDHFSIRWSGQVAAPTSGTYQFSTVADDGVRLVINGVTVIDRWSDSSRVTNTAFVALRANERVNIVLEYFENTGNASIALHWTPPDESTVTIPQANLFPTVGELVPVIPVTAMPLPTPSNPPSTSKKLIEVGWDAPFPDYLKKNITTMEQRPFDGTMVNLHAGKTFLNRVPYPDTAYDQDRADLAAIADSPRLNENFVTMWSAREAGWDWFNDADWAAAETNARNFARTAKAGKFTGIMFDPEPYGTNPWSYSATLYPTQTFASAQMKVRERGAAFMKAVQGEMPNIKILTLFNASIVRQQANDRGSLEKADWVLYASFIDGMLDVIDPSAELIDGNELSYYNLKSGDFDAYPADKQASREYISPANREKYDRQVKIGHAVFVDGTLNIYNSPRFFGFYLRGDDERRQLLESNTYHALRTTDEYVWVYNENMDWWGSKGSGVQLPSGVKDVMGRARQKIDTGQPLGLSIDRFVNPAKTQFSAKVEIDGRVTTNGVGERGSGLAGVTLSSGFTFQDRDVACEISQGEGYFQCFVPPNWTGRITPSLSGYTFNPPYFQATNITATTDNVTFEGRRP